jgi:hypothetical protein
VHQTKMTHRTPKRADSGMRRDEVAEAARTVGSGRNSRHCTHQLYHQKWPPPSASCALMMPNVAGRAQPVCSHGGGGEGGGGEGGGGRLGGGGGGEGEGGGGGIGGGGGDGGGWSGGGGCEGGGLGGGAGAGLGGAGEGGGGGGDGGPLP